MCRGAKSCTVLGGDPATWSTLALLPPPNWFEEQFQLLCESIYHAADGEVSAAREVLGRIRCDDLREWFVEHGQVSGHARTRHFGRSTTKTDPLLRDKTPRPSKALKQTVFARDG